MNGKHAAMALLGAMALVAAFLSMRGSFRPDSGREAVPGPDRRGGVAETVVAAAREPEAPGSTPAARTVVETSPAPATASLTGRCVDGEGRPLHGAEVKLIRERSGDPIAEAEARLRGAQDPWNEPEPVVTGADGRFSFRFAPPLLRSVVVQASKAGHVSLQVFRETAAGGAVDVGDLVMPSGCLLKGRVLDRSGNGVRGMQLGLMPEGQSKGDWRFFATTDASGDFELYSPAPPGRYRVTCDWPISPGEVDLGAAIERNVTFSIDRPGVAATIEGVLVDRRRRSLADRRVRAGDGRLGWRDRTDAHGRFVLELRSDDPGEPVTLSTQLEYYDWLEHPEPVPWGARDVTFVVDSYAVEIVARDGATGDPIERYGVRFVPIDGAGVAYDSSRRLLGVGDHDEGRLRLDDVRPGEYRLSVEPAGEHHAPSPYEPVTVADRDLGPLVVELWPPSSVEVRVATAAGAPIAGSTVRVLQAEPGSVEEPGILKPRSMPSFGRGKGIVLAEASSGGDGRAFAQVPRGGPFAVQVEGRHRPFYATGFTVTGGTATWTCTVEVGATVVVRIAPRPLPADRGARLMVGTPSVQVPGEGWSSPRDGVRSDGSTDLEIPGVAPGEGVLRVPLYGVVPDVHDRHLTVLEQPLTELRDGERRQVAVDVAAWLPVLWSSRLTIDGEPGAGATIILTNPDAEPGRRLWRSAEASADGEGAVRLAVVPGDYDVWLKPADSRLRHRLETCTVGSAGLHREYEIRTASPSVRLLAADGTTPLEGVTLFDLPGRPFTTERDGTLPLGRLVCGMLELRMSPKGSGDRPGSGVERIVLRAKVVPGMRRLDLIAPPESGY